MLVLSRRIGEELVIDGDIRVTVVEVRGSVVRLGISAPKSVSVLRKEIVDRKLAEAQPATEMVVCLPRPNLGFRNKTSVMAGAH